MLFDDGRQCASVLNVYLTFVHFCNRSVRYKVKSSAVAKKPNVTNDSIGL